MESILSLKFRITEVRVELWKWESATLGCYIKSLISIRFPGTMDCIKREDCQRNKRLPQRIKMIKENIDDRKPRKRLSIAVRKSRHLRINNIH